MAQDPALTVDTLARLLGEAKDAHAAYERELGRPHEEWQTWYAEFVLARLRDDRERDSSA